jgi:hypothetical protein
MREGAMLRILGLGFLFALAVSVTGAMAADAVLGGVSIKLPPPDGFCELAASYPADNRALTAVGKVLESGGNKLLGMSADCRQLADWRIGQRNFLDDYGQYQTPIAQMDQLVSSPRTMVSDTCAGMQTAGKAIADSLTPSLQSIIEHAVKTVKMNSMSFAGVLAEDQTACYAAEVQNLTTETGTEKIQLGLLGVTVVKNKSVYAYRFSIYTPSVDVKGQLAKLQSAVASLQVANK